MAAPWEHLQDVDSNRLLAVVPLPHAATTDICVRQPKALVIPGMQIADDLVDAWIWWLNANQPDQGALWVPHHGWAHTVIAPPTDPRPAPSTGGRNGPPHNQEPTPSTSHRTKTWRTGKAGQPVIGSATSGTWWSGTCQERRRHVQGSTTRS